MFEQVHESDLTKEDVKSIRKTINSTRSIIKLKQICCSNRPKIYELRFTRDKYYKLKIKDSSYESLYMAYNYKIKYIEYILKSAEIRIRKLRHRKQIKESL